MPINAGAIGIQPVGPQRPAGGVDGIQRRDDGTSGGFRPQTEVSLKTAIDDLAATLGRIASQEKYGIAKLPSNIGQVVRNILQQSLSMEETLAQGIGSTIESQRFSTEQLAIFARMLAQIGALAEKGFSMELSDETKALLTQFKNAVVESEGGRIFEPVLISKAAFELVDSKTPEQLPPALLQMLTQSMQSSEPTQFLRQLVDLLMPKPRAEGNSAQVQQQSAQVQQQARPTATQQRLNFTYRQFDAPYSQPANQSAPVQNSPASTAQPQQPTNQQAPLQNNAAPNSPASTAQPQQPANQPAPIQTPNIQNQPAQPSPTANQPANIQNQPAQPSPTANQPQQPANQQAPLQPANLSTANQQAPQQPANQPANIQSQLSQFSQPIQSTVEQTANQSANIQNQPAQPTPTANQPAPLQMPNIQNQPAQSTPTANQPTQQPVAQNFSTANQPVLEQPANIQNQPTQSTPTANQQQQPANLSTANQSPPLQNNAAQNSPAQFSQPIQSTVEQPANQPANIQNQPAQPTPIANQPAAAVTEKNSPVSQPPISNQQAKPSTANQQPAAAVPRDDFTVNLPKKPQASPVDEDFIARQRELMAQMQFAKTQLLQQPVQNTPQTTDALKNLAQFLMRNPASAESMSQRETTLLQNFVNNQQTVLPRDEARHLQNLLRLCQQNVPAVVQQAAAQHKLPDLPRLWAFMQLCDMASLPAHMPARALKRAAREVSDFSNAIRQSMSGDNTTVQNQRSFQMMLPLYLGENISSYPTYLSVYDETARDKETGAEKKETWLRICVLTDNIGAAELIFRVYEKTQLDMRFYFSQGEVAEDFKSYVASLRNFIGGTSFNIGEIRIGSIGEKLLLAQ